jgi:LPXTG-site transpeptidase (sortase) family protein
MTRDEKHGRRLRRSAVAVAVLLVLAGVAAVVVALTSQVHAPQPPASASAPPAAAAAGGIPAGGIPAASPSVGPPTTPPVPTPVPGGVPPLPPAQPTRVTIPAIGVSSELLQLGQNPDGTVQVPPLAADSKAGWYRYSPTPGELGPSVVLGHVDSAEYGAGVFFRLGALRPGDTVQVARSDHTVATFRVTRVVSYPKDDFPTLQVYGNTQDAELRLITCGGAFDRTARSYVDNIVVFASLAGVSSA